MNVFVFVAVPYIAIAIFLVGHYWRYRYDKFVWTAQSSQLYERRLLRIGSPSFHFRHPVRVPRPRRRTGHPRVKDQGCRHYRDDVSRGRGVTGHLGRVLHAGWRCDPHLPQAYGRADVLGQTRNDKAMYVLLIATIVLGLGTTVLGNLTGHPHDYRQTVSPWFRSIF